MALDFILTAAKAVTPAYMQVTTPWSSVEVQQTGKSSTLLVKLNYLVVVPNQDIHQSLTEFLEGLFLLC